MGIFDMSESDRETEIRLYGGDRPGEQELHQELMLKEWDEYKRREAERNRVNKLRKEQRKRDRRLSVKDKVSKVMKLIFGK